MQKTVGLVSAFLVIAATNCWAQQNRARQRAEEIEIVDLAGAAKDPDFLVQGEYLGELVNADGSREKVGSQVIARGNGKFVLYGLEGGLPGAGWKKGDGRFPGEGKRDGQITNIKTEAAIGQIVDGTMTVESELKDGTVTLKRVERKSPTMGAKPPESARILYSGPKANAFKDAKISDNGNLIADTVTKDKFNSYRLHLEFRLSFKPQATGQARSNSGVYLHDCYEVQVLDSFGLEGADNECGGLYQIKAPDVNMCLPPLVWQTYDIDFTAPEYDASGKKSKSARLTVRHNGVLIHDDIELAHATPGRQKEGPGPRPLYLQGHHNHVEYRNIWLLPEEAK